MRIELFIYEWCGDPTVYESDPRHASIFNHSLSALVVVNLLRDGVLCPAVLPSVCSVRAGGNEGGRLARANIWHHKRELARKMRPADDDRKRAVGGAQVPRAAI